MMPIAPAIAYAAVTEIHVSGPASATAHAIAETPTPLIRRGVMNTKMDVTTSRAPRKYASGV